MIKDELPNSSSKEDNETRIIFWLADFFKSQDPAKCYDLAERLYKRWQLENSHQEFTNETVVNEKKSKTIEISTPIRENRIFNKGISSEKIEPEQNKNKYIKKKYKNYKTIDFYNLYNTAFKNQEKLKMKREVRDKETLKGCTFSPQMATKNSSYNNQNLGNSFQRLTTINPKLQQETLSDQKQILETQHCTFSPDLPNLKKNHTYNSSNGEGYKRYHHERKIIEENNKLKKEILDAKKLDPCTFNPKINNDKKELHKRNSTYEKLYNDHERKRRKV